MKDILKRLYDGEIYPAEQIVVTSKAYKEKLANAVAIEQGFRDRLPPDMKQVFSDILHMRNELESMEIEKACIEGMKIGGRLAAELLNGHEESENHGETEFEP